MLSQSRNQIVSTAQCGITMLIVKKTYVILEAVVVAILTLNNHRDILPQQATTFQKWGKYSQRPAWLLKFLTALLYSR